MNDLIKSITLKVSASMKIYWHDQGLASCQLSHKNFYTAVTLITFKIPDQNTKQDKFSKL